MRLKGWHTVFDPHRKAMFALRLSCLSRCEKCSGSAFGALAVTASSHIRARSLNLNGETMPLAGMEGNQPTPREPEEPSDTAVLPCLAVTRNVKLPICFQLVSSGADTSSALDSQISQLSGTSQGGSVRVMHLITHAETDRGGYIDLLIAPTITTTLCTQATRADMDFLRIFSL